MKKITVLFALGLTACASNVEKQIPVGRGGGPNELQTSVCNCGGLESEKRHKIRQKIKKTAAETGAINTDIVKDD